MHKILFSAIEKADSAVFGLLADVEYDGQLSVAAYVVLAVILLGIITGLGWCFYRALTATNSSAEPQSPDEVGD